MPSKSSPDKQPIEDIPTSPFDPKAYEEFMRQPPAPAGWAADPATPEPDVSAHPVEQAKGPAEAPQFDIPAVDLSGQRMGQYTIIQPIGRGGMATVYLAHQAAMLRNVAIKVLPPQFAHDPTFAARFHHEAELAARLEHQNILPVYDYGEEQGYTYIVMRYVPMGSLRARMNNAALTPLSAYKIAVQVARALDYAHKQSVLHRDVKPSNVLIDSDEQAYLTDFGIAKVMLEGPPSYRTASHIVGTPGYMAPEQVRGEHLDARADVYALGALVFEMLTGHAPYSAHTPIGTAIKHVVDPVPDPRMHRSDLPEPIAKAIRRAMAKAPDNRYHSAAEFSDALSEAFKFAPRVWLETGHDNRLPPDPSEAELLAAEPTEFLEFDETEAFSAGSLSHLADDTSLRQAQPAGSFPDIPIIPDALRRPRAAEADTQRAVDQETAESPPAKEDEPASEVTRSRLTGLLSAAEESTDERPAVRQLVEQPGGVGVHVKMTRHSIWPDTPPAGAVAEERLAESGQPLVISGAEFAQRMRAKYSGEDVPAPAPERVASRWKRLLERLPRWETGWRYFTTALSIAGAIVAIIILSNVLRNRTPTEVPTPVATVALTEAAPATPTPLPQPTATSVRAFPESEALPRVNMEPRMVHFGWRSIGDGDQIYDLALSKNYVWAATGSGLIRWDDEGQFTRFASEHGLASNRTRAVAIQPDGTLWVGTLGSGLSQYDGASWATFTTEDGLPGNDIYALALDETGTLWAGTNNGLAHYDDGEWSAYTVVNGLGSQVVLDLAFDGEGALWAITTPGVSRFDGETLVTFEALDSFGGAATTAVEVDAAGQIWVGTAGSGVAHYDGSSWQRFVGAGLDRADVHSIAAAWNGDLWLGTSDGLRVFDGTDWTIVNVEDGLPGPDVWAVAAHPDSGLWAGTQSGLARDHGRRWEALTTGDGLSSSVVQALDFDSRGQAWIGAYDGGVATYNGNTWHTFSTDDGLAADDVWTLLVDQDDTVWAGTLGSGLSRYDGVGWQTYTVADGLAGNDIWTLAVDPQENLWVTTSARGVFIFDDEAFIPQPVTGAGEPWALAFDENAGQWMGTFDGVLSRAPESGTVWSAIPNTDAAPTDRVLVAQVDDAGRVWLGTAGGGVLMFNGATWANFTEDDGLASNTVWAIAFGQDNGVWFGTASGISYYNGVSWRSYGTADGLAGKEVRALAVAPDGRLWVGTTGGLSVVEPRDARLYE